MSPGLAGGFFATQPPGKACFSVYKSSLCCFKNGCGGCRWNGGESEKKEMSKDIIAAVQVRGDDGFDQGCIVGFWL